MGLLLLSIYIMNFQIAAIISMVLFQLPAFVHPSSSSGANTHTLLSSHDGSDRRLAVAFVDTETSFQIQSSSRPDLCMEVEKSLDRGAGRIKLQKCKAKGSKGIERQMFDITDTGKLRASTRPSSCILLTGKKALRYRKNCSGTPHKNRNQFLYNFFDDTINLLGDGTNVMGVYKVETNKEVKIQTRMSTKVRTQRWKLSYESDDSICSKSSSVPTPAISCLDDPSFTFVLPSNGLQRNCAWIKTKNKMDQFCKKTLGGSVIKERCQRTCNYCTPSTSEPSSIQTSAPTVSPTASPTESPTANPTAGPTESPTASPSSFPSLMQSMIPSSKFSLVPSTLPSMHPSITGYSWIQVGSDIDGESDHDLCGYSVSLSADGKSVAIGAIHNDGNGSDSGHVRVYHLIGSVWVQLGQDIDGEAPGDMLGHRVSLSADGNRLAIGARKNDANGYMSGHVRVYELRGSVWNQLGLDIDGEGAIDESGHSVSLSGDGKIVAIGAPDNDGNGSGSGHVRVYSWDGSAWIQLGSDLDGEARSDWFGIQVSLSFYGKIVAIGATHRDGKNGTDSGYVKVYAWNGSSWSQLGEDIEGDAPDDRFGLGVSLSFDGTRIAIGGEGHDGTNGSNSGLVRVYDLIGGVWTQVGQDIEGEATEDRFGSRASLSADGQRVAIGGYFNDGVNGANSGHVRVFGYEGGSWNQLGQDIDGEAEWDSSGYSVSLSADGKSVAIGAYSNNGNGFDSGHVRVYMASFDP